MDKIMYTKPYPVDHNLNEATVRYEAISQQMIGGVYRIYNKMEFGFLELVNYLVTTQTDLGRS